METIEVRFTDLRRAAEQVPAFVEDRLGCKAECGLRTGVEEDMSITGLDTEELLLEFSEQFSVDLSQFDFTGLITPESVGNPLHLILFLLFLPVYAVAWTTKLLLGLVYLPFNSEAAISLIKKPISNPFASPPKPRHEILTIGDFVASAAAGRFVKRERVRFVLV
ncbi:DUF1493 family protein [Hymenobacter guriensis]|uniref:DUF1493 family protein n=1 Tax=Hymenobacter guriensis TaxID=2793065 RepID=A0ABS0L043_9BACT|nr:DUF1493 family protein [Hymenobacter guriensis]MBG8553482.1 DUF1493 family protein [Hymenobacter guriensis]